MIQQEHEGIQVINRQEETLCNACDALDILAQKEHLTPWDQVCMARSPKRPKSQAFIDALFTNFIELHGDRAFGDDQALITGIAMFHGIPVTILAQAKGMTLEENLQRNFGMMHPEGYRKAMRLAKQAEKFKRPIITFVDTAGAYPGKGAEERGQAASIAQCLQLFSQLRVPIICVVLSEGGSGGALALSIGDRIVMMEHAVYSILSPEGFASILWKDGSRAKEAAGLMKLTCDDLMAMGIVDHQIKEPIGGIQTAFDVVIQQLDHYLFQTLQELLKQKENTLLKERSRKYRRIQP